MRSTPVLLAALLLLSACGKADQADKKEAAESGPGFSITAEEAKSLGIATKPANAATWRQQITGYGTVTALDAVAQTDADVLTASAAAAQSAAAAARAKSLGIGEEAAVSREVVEAAESKAAADQAALALARRKTEAAFGIHAPWHNEAERAQIMARLASGATVLVRVTFPLGSLSGPAPGTLRIGRLNQTSQNWTTTRIWDAPADPSLPGRGFYALVDGSDLAQNEHVTASVPFGSAETGVVVPASALVFGESQTWVYVQTAANHFLRAPITTDKAVGDGYFLQQGNGINAGQAIVTNGAGLLLSHEINPSTEADD